MPTFAKKYAFRGLTKVYFSNIPVIRKKKQKKNKEFKRIGTK